MKVGKANIGKVMGSTLIGLNAGSSELVLRHPKLGSIGQVSFNVTDLPVNVLYLDPQIINSVTLETNPTSVLRVSKQAAILTFERTLYFRGQRAEITVSALFSDGTRHQLSLEGNSYVSVQSLNDSIVQIAYDPSESFPHLRAFGMANGDVIQAQWSVCGWTVAGYGAANIVVNLHKPVFNTSSTMVDVPEDASIGTHITRVQAIDFDVSTVHSAIFYSFVEESVPGVFTINQTSGEIKLRQPLDHEVITEYTLKVQATDEEQRKALQGGDAENITDSGLLEPSIFTVSKAH